MKRFRRVFVFTLSVLGLSLSVHAHQAAPVVAASHPSDSILVVLEPVFTELKKQYRKQVGVEVAERVVSGARQSFIQKVRTRYDQLEIPADPAARREFVDRVARGLRIQTERQGDVDTSLDMVILLEKLENTWYAEAGRKRPAVSRVSKFIRLAFFRDFWAKVWTTSIFFAPLLHIVRPEPTNAAALELLGQTALFVFPLVDMKLTSDQRPGAGTVRYAHPDYKSPDAKAAIDILYHPWSIWQGLAHRAYQMKCLEVIFE